MHISTEALHRSRLNHHRPLTVRHKVNIKIAVLNMTPSRIHTSKLRGNSRTGTRITKRAAGGRGSDAVKRMTAAATNAAEVVLDGNVGTRRDEHVRAPTPAADDATSSEAVAPSTSSEAVHAGDYTQHAAAVTSIKTVATATSSSTERDFLFL